MGEKKRGGGHKTIGGCANQVLPLQNKKRKKKKKKGGLITIQKAWRVLNL